MQIDPKIIACAEVAHEANRIYCAAIGDHSQRSWKDAEEWQRRSAIRGVQVALEGATPEQQHQAWVNDKLSDGWRRGPIKDAVAKTHPCLVPYAELSPAQRSKDELYLAVVRAMATVLNAGVPPDPGPAPPREESAGVPPDPGGA